MKRRRPGHSRASGALTQISPIEGSSRPDSPRVSSISGTPGALRRSSTSRTQSPKHESAISSTGTGSVCLFQSQSGTAASTSSARCSISDCMQQPRS